MSKSKDGIFYVEAVLRGQFDSATRDRTIRQTATLDGLTVHQRGEQGAGGVTDKQHFIRILAGFPVSVEKSTGSKELRADPFSSQLNAGNVKVVRGDWNKKYIEELSQFPRGKHDDMVDGSSLAFNRLNRRQSKVSIFRI